VTRPGPVEPTGRLRTRAARAARPLLAAALGVAAALLVACGSSGNGLLAASQGGPLESDIEAVDQAAQAGNGNCAATESALLKTEQDFAALPSSTDSGLRNTLRQGIENLHKVAIEACRQPLVQTETTTTPKTTTTTTPPPTTTETQTTPTETQTTPPSEEGESGAGGGTPAPGEGPGRAPGEGSGGAGAEEGSGGPGGSEGGK
jgi:hypothetical protein